MHSIEISVLLKGNRGNSMLQRVLSQDFPLFLFFCPSRSKERVRDRREREKGAV